MVQTTTITVNIGNDVIDELRRLASKEKQKKGFLGRTISEATKKDAIAILGIDEKRLEVISAGI